MREGDTGRWATDEQLDPFANIFHANAGVRLSSFSADCNTSGVPHTAFSLFLSPIFHDHPPNLLEAHPADPPDRDISSY